MLRITELGSHLYFKQFCCVPGLYEYVRKPWLLFKLVWFFYILINLFFVVIECVNVLRYLKGRFLSILFILLGSPLHFTDSQLIVGKGVKD